MKEVSKREEKPADVTRNHKETFLSLPQVDIVGTRQGSPDAMRKELYNEINAQIIHWVICESAQLSSQLDELTERINQLENDSEPEIDSIKEEAMRISREIEIYRTHLSSDQ